MQNKPNFMKILHNYYEKSRFYLELHFFQQNVVDLEEILNLTCLGCISH